MHDRALNHALETKRRLSIDVVRAGHGRRVVMNEIAQVLTQIFNVGCAGTQHLSRGRIVQKGEQEMLDRNELMPRLTCFHKRHVQTDFQFLGNHASSITHCSG